MRLSTLLFAGSSLALAASSSRIGGRTQPTASTSQKPRRESVAFESLSSTSGSTSSKGDNNRTRLYLAANNYAKTLHEVCLASLDSKVVGSFEENMECAEVYKDAQENINNIVKAKIASEGAQQPSPSIEEIYDNVLADYENDVAAMSQAGARIGRNLRAYIQPYKDEAAILKLGNKSIEAQSRLGEELYREGGVSDPNNFLGPLLENFENQVYFNSMRRGGEIYYRKNPVSPTTSPSPTLTPTPSAIPTLEPSNDAVTAVGLLVPILGSMAAAGVASLVGFVIYKNIKYKSSQNGNPGLEGGVGREEETA